MRSVGEERAPGARLGQLSALWQDSRGSLCWNCTARISDMPHVVVWHVAVVPIAALAGYLVGSKRKAAELMQ